MSDDSQHSAKLRRILAHRDRILSASKLLESDPQGFELWETPKRRYWVPAASRYMLPFNLAEQECKIYGTGPYGPQHGDVVLDCGANMGVTVHEELAQGADRVVGIEPGPENVECLRRTFEKEIRCGRVDIIPKGVWDKEDCLPLRVDPINSAANSFVLNPEGTIEIGSVPVTTIDAIVSELELKTVDYMKFDIEGAEARALAGARCTLAKFRPRISIAAYHHADDPQVISELIRAATLPTKCISMRRSTPMRSAPRSFSSFDSPRPAERLGRSTSMEHAVDSEPFPALTAPASVQSSAAAPPGRACRRVGPAGGRP